MNITIVVPFYNEKKHIKEVVDGLSSYRLPVVVVDDGSSDSYALKNSPKVTLLKHKINLGKGAAMKTGTDFAFSNGADAVIFMDGDNQHKPEDIKKFIEVLQTGKYDAVFGARNFNYSVPLIRYMGNKVVSMLLRILFGIYVSDVLCGFKALTKKAYKAVYWESTGYGVETEMIARFGKNKLTYKEVSIEAIYHDKVKGVTVLDAFGIMGQIVKWKLTI